MPTSVISLRRKFLFQTISAGPKRGCLNVGAGNPQESGRKAPLSCNAALSMLRCRFSLAAAQLLVKMTSALQKSECCSATSAAQHSKNCSATSVFACVRKIPAPILPPPPKSQNTPPSKTRNFMDMEVFLRKESKTSRRPENWRTHFRPQNRRQDFNGHEVFFFLIHGLCTLEVTENDDKSSNSSCRPFFFAAPWGTLNGRGPDH